MKSESSFTKIYFESAIVGSIRGLVSLPFEHPFDVIKTRMQSTDKVISSIEVSRTYY